MDVLNLPAIGRGVKTLINFVNKCEKSNGQIMIRAQKNGVAFVNHITIACYGATKKAPGGTITGLSKELVNKIRKEQKLANSVTASKLRRIISKHLED